LSLAIDFIGDQGTLLQIIGITWDTRQTLCSASGCTLVLIGFIINQGTLL
jgi:hypothetical protein